MSDPDVPSFRPSRVLGQHATARWARPRAEARRSPASARLLGMWDWATQPFNAVITTFVFSLYLTARAGPTSPRRRSSAGRSPPPDC